MKKVVLATIVCGSVAFAGVNLGACKGCHGAHWEKKALGKSKIVKNLSEADIANALVGYKKGTYGGPMKGVMKGQVARYSEADLKAAAADIKAGK
jgi:cytochrome c-type protein NapB